MAEQGAKIMGEVPRVYVAQRVIDKIVQGALLYPEPETGEAMVGLVVPNAERIEPDIYILDTISPGERAVREWGMFEQGDDWQGDVFHWLYVNWDAFRELRRPSYGKALAAKWDVPLAHVGDWHKQPGDMIEPSGGDAQTARRMIADADTPVEQLVAPIVTMYPLKKEEPATPAPLDGSAAVEGIAAVPPAEAASVAEMPEIGEQTLTVALEDKGWIVRIDFWYMSKRSKKFTPVKPIIWQDNRLPVLPPIAWHLAHPKRFDQEYSLLTDAGYMVDIVRWDADGKPPYEICFSVYKPGSSRVILLVTPVDYPAHMPAVRIAPLVSVAEGEDVFEKLYDASEPVLMTQMPTWDWDSKRTLIELVWHIEKTLQGDKVS